MRTFFLFLLILLPVAALLILNFFISLEFGRIAEAKGHSSRRYFHFCFWLGLVGILMVIALPDRGGNAAAFGPTTGQASPQVPVAFAEERKPQSSPVKPAASRAPAPFTGTVPNPWRCPCGAVNPASKGSCATCGAAKLRGTPIALSTASAAPAAHAWQCSCGKSNTLSRRCPSCSAWLCTCDTLNPASKATCDKCGAAKPR